MAAAGARSNVVEGNSLGLISLFLLFVEAAAAGLALRAAGAVATTGWMRDGGANTSSAGSSTCLGFSVIMVCFLSVFSFFGSGSRAARARSAFHSAHLSEREETNLRRGLRNCASQAKVNV